MADFSLKAVFGMDATGVKTEIKQLRKEMNSFVNEYAKIGAGVAVAAFAALSKGAIDLAGKLTDSANNIGINVVSLQALEAQHKRNGVSGEALQKALEKTKAAVLDAASGNEKATASLAALGLSSEKLIKLPLDKQYEAIAKAAAKAKNENAAYSAICDIMGDKVGPKLMGSLKELGTDGLPAVTKAAKEAGQVMSTETIVALDRAGDAIDDFKKRATIWAGNVIVNFRTEEGLKLIGLQILKVLGMFGGGIADAVVEGGQMLFAVFKGAFQGVTNFWQDGMISAVQVIAEMINKILPKRFEINVGNLDALRSSGKDVGDSIIEAIARTAPSGIKKGIEESYNGLISEQMKIVNAVNAIDLGKDVKKLEAAGNAAAKPIVTAAAAVEDAGKKAGDSLADAAAKAATSLAAIAQTISRTGLGYESQSTTALSGVRSRLASQLIEARNHDRNRGASVGGGGKGLATSMLESELFNVDKELGQRSEVGGYAARFGEDAARFKFGDTATNKALQDLSQETTRTASATESINRNLAKLIGKPI